MRALTILSAVLLCACGGYEQENAAADAYEHRNGPQEVVATGAVSEWTGNRDTVWTKAEPCHSCKINAINDSTIAIQDRSIQLLERMLFESYDENRKFIRLCDSLVAETRWSRSKLKETNDWKARYELRQNGGR